MFRRVLTLCVAVLVAFPLLMTAPHQTQADEYEPVPVSLWIPAIGVDAWIEESDIEQGVMNTPEDPWNVAWYPELGFFDDDQIVMAGHVDYWGYGPTVFANLQDLNNDDEIYVADENGTSYTYIVTDSWIVDSTTPAKETWRIFHPKEEGSLTLITCAGDFNGEGYDARLVIRAELVSVLTLAEQEEAA